MGIVCDGPTYTAVLAVRSEAFALCDSAEQARRLAGGGAILSGVAREGSPIARLQWVDQATNEEGFSKLELRDTESLELLAEVPLPARGVVEHPVFSEDGSRLWFARLKAAPLRMFCYFR